MNTNTHTKPYHDSGINLKKAAMLAFGACFFLKNSKNMFNGIRIFSKEPEACTVMRETLLATKKVDSWAHERDVTKPMSFPRMPFHLIEECGLESFNMPFPYTFRFEENPVEPDVLVERFMANNKTVAYRPSADYTASTNTPFSFTIQKLIQQSWGSFEEAWQCISKGKCILYFDNSWNKDDYTKVMSDEAVKTLLGASDFGATFMSNYDAYALTSAFHAAPIKALSTQMIGAKEWIFIDPAVAKKYLPVDNNFMVTTINSMTQDHDEILKHVPRYFVRNEPGEAVYWPEWWLHMITTDPGLNIMTSWKMHVKYLTYFTTSPHPIYKSILFAVQLTLKEYVFPDWYVKKAYGNSQDLQQTTVHQYHRLRKSVFEANAGAKYL